MQAATADGCEGGNYQLVNLTTNAVVASGPVTTTIPAASFGPGTKFGVRGVYNTFDVGLADFAVLDYAFTGAPNPLDMTGGDLVVSRTGPGLSMKVQTKDCAAGGVFQMEVQRADGTRTRITHRLAQNNGALTPYYLDNPNFRSRIGQFLGADCTSATTGPPSQFCVKVTARVNITNDFSSKLILRDSSQVATRINQPDCNTAAAPTPSVRHCGSQSVWDVASGGRLGFVTGEDATEVANPPTVCTQQCQAQNRVKGRQVSLGFPFPVPAGSRLTPAVLSAALAPLTAP